MITYMFSTNRRMHVLRPLPTPTVGVSMPAMVRYAVPKGANEYADRVTAEW